MNTRLMSQPVNQGLPTFSESEIDLFQLISLLWKKKMVILIITCITTFLAGFYAFFIAEEKWTAKTYISPPRVEQIQSYIDARRAYARIFNEVVDVGAIGGQLFDDFINYAYSPDVKMDFLRQTSFYKTKSERFKTELARRQYLASLVEKNLLINNPEEKKGLRYYSISMSANSPLAAKELVDQYISYLNQKSLIINNYEFNDRLATLMQSLQKEKSNIEEQLKIERENTIESLTDSYSVAKNAGIKDYYDINTRLLVLGNGDKFMMGEKLIAAELEVLKNTPVIYPFRYYQIIDQLEMLDKIGKIDLSNSQVFRYEMKAEEPIVRSEPKRNLILTLGFLLGLLGSIVAVLASNILKSKSLD